MARTARRRRLGWLGWTGAVVLAIALGIAALAVWAVSNDSVATLDRVDALFGRDRAAVMVERGTYGTDPAQKFALYLPEGTAPAGGFPLVVFIHGGGWHSGDPDDYGWIARYLADKGYATALIGYRLNRGARFPNMLLDSAAGTRAALDAAARRGVDTARVALMGHSAGAYNATMLALERRWLADAGVPEAAIRGAIILAGPADFYPFDKKSSINAMGHWPRPAETQPVNFARADAPPMLLVHGTDDTVVRPRNAVALAAALTAAGRPTKATLIDGMGHNGMIITLARPFGGDARVSDAVSAFLARVLAKPPAAAVAAAPASSPVKPGTP